MMKCTNGWFVFFSSREILKSFGGNFLHIISMSQVWMAIISFKQLNCYSLLNDLITTWKTDKTDKDALFEKRAY